MSRPPNDPIWIDKDFTVYRHFNGAKAHCNICGKRIAAAEGCMLSVVVRRAEQHVERCKSTTHAKGERT